MSSTTLKTRAPLPASCLTEEQQQAINRLYNYDETLLIAKVGFGKAVVALTAAQEMLDNEAVSRVLVLAPLRVCTMTWRHECEHWEHLRDDLVGVACGSISDRMDVLSSPAQVIVTNFENLQWVLAFAGTWFDGMIIDECTKLKTPGGGGAKLLRHWVKGLKWRVGMTGTPVAETGTDIYTQALLLDLGRGLGTRMHTFKHKYFAPTDHEQRHWELLPGAAEKIGRALRHLVYVADDAGYWASLPPVRDHIISVELTDYSRELYTQMRKHSVVQAYDGREVVAESAAVQQGKLCQIAAGGLYDNEGNLCHDDHEKMTVLISMVTGLVIGERRSVIIVYQYSFELAWLRALYPEAPILGAGGKVSTELVEQWSRGEHPVVIMHPKSAAHGLNFQYGGHTIVHLSPLWGADPWAQCLGRIRRRGQRSAWVDRYIMVASGTVEEEILDRLAGKLEGELVLMDGLAVD